MDKSESICSDLKPVLFSKSPIINNSGTESESNEESGRREHIKSKNESVHKYDKSPKNEKRSKHHRSKRSRSKNNRRSGSKRRSSQNRNRSRSRSNRKDRRHKDSSRSDHRGHRKKRSRSPREHSQYRSYKDNRRQKETNDCREPITRAPRSCVDESDDVGKQTYKRPQIKRDEELRKTEELTGVKIPSYLNTSAVNPMKYAETEQKRKLLWSKKDDSKKLNILAWNASSVIASRGDDRKAAKFRKLMGIHDEPNALVQNSQDLFRKEHEQAELFSRLDADYQSARSQTHTSRGVGLGYNQSAYIDPLSYLAGRREEN